VLAALPTDRSERPKNFRVVAPGPAVHFTPIRPRTASSNRIAAHCVRYARTASILAGMTSEMSSTWSIDCNGVQTSYINTFGADPSNVDTVRWTIRTAARWSGCISCSWVTYRTEG